MVEKKHPDNSRSKVIKRRLNSDSRVEMNVRIYDRPAYIQYMYVRIYSHMYMYMYKCM